MSQPLAAVDAQVPSPAITNVDAVPVADYPVSAVSIQDTDAHNEPLPEAPPTYQDDCSIVETVGDVPMTQERPNCSAAQVREACQQGLDCDVVSHSEVKNSQQAEVEVDGCLRSPGVAVQDNFVEQGTEMRSPLMNARDGSLVLREDAAVSMQQPVIEETREMQIAHQVETLCEDANNHIPPIHDDANEGAQEPVTEDDVLEIDMAREAKEASVASSQELTEAQHHRTLSVSDSCEQHIPDTTEAITSDSITLDDNQHRQLPPPFFPAGSLAAVLTCLRDGNAMISNVVNQLRHVNMILEEKSGVAVSSDKMHQIPV